MAFTASIQLGNRKKNSNHSSNNTSLCGIHVSNFVWALVLLSVMAVMRYNDKYNQMHIKTTTAIAATEPPPTTQQQQARPPSSQRPPQQANPTKHHYLEQLLYRYGSDKSHDDHSYSDLYQMLFDPIRYDVKNVMEIGVAAGQSIQAWYHYFPNAKIYAFDVRTLDSVQRVADQLSDRVIYRELNLLDAKLYGDTNTTTTATTNTLRDRLEQHAGIPRDIQFDVLVEDAMHTPDQQQQFISQLFDPLVRPGGYYIVEDIATSRPKARIFVEQPEQLRPDVNAILQAHVGHRAWDEWKRRSGQVVRSHAGHNSNALVIRKRHRPLPPQVKMFAGETAMVSDKVVLDTEEELKHSS
eukprot:CAMPEP_0168767410 /NCGR_PEP_ID=MMETSP0725-20121227/1344_1 /TAXON_ID=265536 /ORGANISM="Amphiprora sp., Strain CCMP467" /LENGTH=353 /DNA_ID=CAMNT_0008816731 /DNA_START=105 /DNA_END=1166 /DNA_ORIENTATION=+